MCVCNLHGSSDAPKELLVPSLVPEFSSPGSQVLGTIWPKIIVITINSIYTATKLQKGLYSCILTKNDSQYKKICRPTVSVVVVPLTGQVQKLLQ